MAKYQLPQYQSVYRDTGSVQVNQLKRQMFLENMKADDALSTSVMNMDALDKDKEQMNSLAEVYNNNISERAARKDYENLGMTIHTDAMNFIKDYTPIKKSKDLYTAYEKMLSERVAKGDITDSIKQRKLAQSLSKYKGIQKSATGVIDGDSYFKGANVTAFVDVNAEIQKAMKDVIPREKGIKGFELRDGDFDVFLSSRTMTGDPKADGAVWKIKQGEKIVEVPDYVVESVTKDILRRQDVAGFINQEADLNTYMFSQEEATEKINESIVKIDEMIAKIPSLEKLTADEKKEAIKSQKELKESILEKQKTMNSVDLLKSMTRNDLNNQYMKSATNKYVYSNVFVDKDISVIDKEGVGSSQNNDQVILSGEVSDSLTAEVLGGKTLKSKRAFQLESQNYLDERTSQFGTEFNNDMLNANTEADINALAAKYNLVPQDILAQSKQVKRHQDNVDLMEIQLEDAIKNATGGQSKEEYDAEVSDTYATKTNPRYKQTERFPTDVDGNMLLKALQLPIHTIGMEVDPNTKEIINRGTDNQAILPADATVKDAMDWLRDNVSEQDNMSTSQGILKGHPMQKTLMQALVQANGIELKGETTVAIRYKNNALSALADDNGMVSSEYLSLGESYLRLLEMYNKDQNKTEKKIEEHLNTQQIKFDNTIATSFGDKTEETRKEIRETIAKGIPGDFITYTDGSNEGIKWDDAMKADYEGKDFEIVPELSGLSNISMMDGTPLMAIAVKSEGKIKMYNINAKQIGMPSVDEYTASTGYKVRAVYARGEWANVDEWSPKLFSYEEQIDPEDASKGTQEVQGVMFKYNSDPEFPVHIRQKDGTYKRMSEKAGLEYIEKFVEEKGIQNYIY